MNASAVTSLDEGFEGTLTLHRLRGFGALGISLKTTTCLEFLNGLIGQQTGRVTHWRASEQKHRCLAAALLDIEPQLRRIKGFQALPLLRNALQAQLQEELRTAGTEAA